ncbi:MAG: hypothetical protein GY863_11625 [bacterium]|nr:hypothetical protein [bacterium]
MRAQFKYPALILFIIVLCFSGITTAQVKLWKDSLSRDPENTELLMILGKYYHNAAGEGVSETAVLKAEKYLQKILEIESRNGTAMVYLGSVFTMKARDTLIPWKKWDYMQDGFRMIDKGIKTEPENTEARLVRAIHCVNVPSYFGRLDTGLEDFEFLSRAVEKENSGLSEDFLLPYYYYYGIALIEDEKYEEAKKMLRKAAETAPGSDYAIKALHKLRSLEKN